ncbi:isoprenylcysteine carboxylmethyltransferase family protein [Fulvivirgaceae bacterium PWU4]|uniref:Isoprenylcysteine carboxylmethyltransferase family protein n=1 Tax=Chryseosolibacter histidini TaxID=2782349 RepID=A0AAP2DS40_9BACT|nr:isoprenylcysteine carboxylmethyltransferase family protein [Chryseosolibacter histidini]MBT1699987.1 isoprenylcysteine carboxylmethyltransferase family protein [Chryseosolibacter histidini]
MKTPSIVAHLRDVLILPFTVTCIIPYLIYDPVQHFISDHLLIRAVGFLFLLSGLSLFLYTVFLFRTIGKGTLAPWSAKQKLVVVGPYRYCRNPMITGVLFILIGETLVFHSTSILVWAATFFVINTIYFMLSEEPGLLARFGDEYQHYKKHVPRWIPRLTPYDTVE